LGRIAGKLPIPIRELAVRRYELAVSEKRRKGRNGLNRRSKASIRPERGYS